MNQRDCLIIGGGVIGLATAWHLANAGARVTLLDRQSTGREASWAGGGILCPLYGWRYPASVMALAAAGMRRYPEWIARIKAQASTDPEFSQPGLLILDPLADGAHRTSVDQWVNEYRLRAEWSAADTHFSHLSTDSALWLPEIHALRNPRLLRALREVALSAGVNLIEHEAVHSLWVEGRRVRGANTPEGSLPADCVLVAAGAWTGHLVPGLTPAQVFPVRGQMLRFEAHPGIGLPTVIMDQGIYLIPRADGSVVVGSTVEHAGFDKHPTAEAQAHLHRAAIALWPNLAHAQVAQRWAGLRPGTTDERPFLGEHPTLDGLFVATGFYRNGLAMAPAAAEAMSALIQQKTPELDLSPFRLDRPGGIPPAFPMGNAE
ncbi:glycine oxidase ThiO [Halothiobacillus sp. DCM-1]|uniref:glycine oxidase ThiO n=1 Tax=Halothiobacillus sp. DCM-1 TaxID=3112558 RepID=UPI00325615DB